MTKIVNLFAISTGAIFLVLCGLFPKLAAIIQMMPQSVLGGAAVMMFASIVVSGIQLVTKDGVSNRTVTIVSVALVWDMVWEQIQKCFLIYRNS